MQNNHYLQTMWLFYIPESKELNEKILEFKSSVRGQFKPIYPMFSPIIAKTGKKVKWRKKESLKITKLHKIFRINLTRN